MDQATTPISYSIVRYETTSHPEETFELFSYKNLLWTRVRAKTHDQRPRLSDYEDAVRRGTAILAGQQARGEVTKLNLLDLEDDFAHAN